MHTSAPIPSNLQPLTPFQLLTVKKTPKSSTTLLTEDHLGSTANDDLSAYMADVNITPELSSTEQVFIALDSTGESIQYTPSNSVRDPRGIPQYFDQHGRPYRRRMYDPRKTRLPPPPRRFQPSRRYPPTRAPFRP